MILKVLLISIKMKTITWNEADKGSTFEYTDIPEDLVSKCDSLRRTC